MFVGKSSRSGSMVRELGEMGWRWYRGFTVTNVRPRIAGLCVQGERAPWEARIEWEMLSLCLLL